MRKFMWDIERLLGVLSALAVVSVAWFPILFVYGTPINGAHVIISLLSLHVLWGACDRSLGSTAIYQSRIRHLEEDLKEEEDLRERIGRILENTANALHGGPLENGWWSTHDLPELAETMRNQLQKIAKDYVDATASEGSMAKRLEEATGNVEAWQRAFNKNVDRVVKAEESERRAVKRAEEAERLVLEMKRTWHEPD